MDEFTAQTASQLQRIKQLEEFISLYFRKKETISELKQLSAKMEDVRVLVDDCAQMMDTFHEVVGKEYKEVMLKMQAQQLTMLNIIKELRKRKAESSKENVTPRDMGASSATGLTENNKLVTPPRMYLSDYKQSPFILRMRPVALQFLDFETKITPEMFESIPKYIRGRETIDQLLAFVDQIIIPCFTEKYQLMYKTRSCVKNQNDLQLWNLFQSQARSFPKRKFITEGDISRKLHRMVDKKTNTKLMMLRHLGILQEKREQSTIFYIWVKST